MLTKDDKIYIEDVIDRKFDENFDRKFDERFDLKFDQKFDEKFDQKFDEKFTPIKQDIDDRFDIIVRNMATKDELAELRGMVLHNSHMIESILTMMDRFIKKADRQWDEQMVLTGRVELHEKWIRELASGTGTDLRI